MRRAWTISLVAAAGVVGVLLADPASFTLERPAQLSPSPGAPSVAVLMAGASLEVIERREGWTRIRLEGWIADDAVAPAGAGDSAAGRPDPAGAAAPPPDRPASSGDAPAPEPVRPAAAASSSRSSLRGVLFVVDEEGRTVPGSGAVVRLLDISGPDAAGLEAHRRECAARQAELSSRAAELKDRAGRALRSIESTSRAFEENDKAKTERDAVRRRMASEARACRAREDELLETAAAQRAITGADGRYVFEDVPAGRYTLQATLEEGVKRHQWMVAVSLPPGGSHSVDLTSLNRTAVEEIPQSR